MKIYSSEVIKAKLTRKRKIGKICFAALGIVLVFALLCAISVLCQRLIFKSKTVGLFGFTPFIVTSGSMQPSLNVYDVVVVKKVGEDKIKQGDVISFFDDSGAVVTHRVAQVTVNDGKTCYTTRGDANSGNDRDPVYYENIIGRYSFRVPNGGYIIAAVLSPAGIILFVLLVAVILLFVLLKGIKKANRHAVRENYKDRDV